MHKKQKRLITLVANVYSYNTALFIPLQRIIHFRLQPGHCRPVHHNADISGKDAVTWVEYLIRGEIAFEDSFYPQQTK